MKFFKTLRKQNFKSNVTETLTKLPLVNRSLSKRQLSLLIHPLSIFSFQLICQNESDANKNISILIHYPLVHKSTMSYNKECVPYLKNYNSAKN